MSNAIEILEYATVVERFVREERKSDYILRIGDTDMAIYQDKELAILHAVIINNPNMVDDRFKSRQYNIAQ